MPTFRRKPSTLPAPAQNAAEEAHAVSVANAAARMVDDAGIDPAGNSLDVCSAMFDVCRSCQEAHLDRLGATCMFDVDGGQVPSWMFEILRGIVEMVVADIAAGAPGRTPGAAVGITLRRTGNFWALAIAENITGETGERRAARRLTMVRALTDRLECVCRILPNAWGSTIAIAFPVSDTPTGGAAQIPHDRVLH